METGTIVRIKREWLDNPNEIEMIFVVVDDRGDRALISPINSNLAITPTELVKVEMLEVVNG